MRITSKKTITKEITFTEDILCNKCGKTCKMPHAQLQHYGLIEAEVTGGFDSTALEDLHTYTFSICEVCLKELFDTFSIPVEVGRYDI